MSYHKILSVEGEYSFQEPNMMNYHTVLVAIKVQFTY